MSLRRTDVGLVAGIVVALAVAGAAAAVAGSRTDGVDPGTIEIGIRYSHFEPARVDIPAGVAVTIVLRNDDPIDHEWILGDDGVHDRHRNGTEPVHESRPTEITIPAGESRTTTIVVTEAGRLSYICHLPGHESYGMVGELLAGDP